MNDYDIEYSKVKSELSETLTELSKYLNEQYDRSGKDEISFQDKEVLDKYTSYLYEALKQSSMHKSALIFRKMFKELSKDFNIDLRESSKEIESWNFDKRLQLSFFTDYEYLDDRQKFLEKNEGAGDMFKFSRAIWRSEFYSDLTKTAEKVEGSFLNSRNIRNIASQHAYSAPTKDRLYSLIVTSTVCDEDFCDLTNPEDPKLRTISVYLGKKRQISYDTILARHELPILVTILNAKIKKLEKELEELNDLQNRLKDCEKKKAKISEQHEAPILACIMNKRANDMKINMEQLKTKQAILNKMKETLRFSKKGFHPQITAKVRVVDDGAATGKNAKDKVFNQHLQTDVIPVFHLSNGKVKKSSLCRYL